MEHLSIMEVASSSGHPLLILHCGEGICDVSGTGVSALKMPELRRGVEPVPIGGGFGGKETLIEPLVAAVAFRPRKPVRLVYTRQEDLLAGNPAPHTVIAVKLGAKRDGTLTAIQARMILDSGAYPNPLAGFSSFHFAGIYRCPNLDIRCDVVQTNKPGTGAYRAPAGPQAYFALESTVQELCLRLGMDPLQFRQINALKEGDLNIRHGHWPRIGFLECLEQIQQHPLWAQREQASQEAPAE